jgi:hypothetical protein
VESPPAVEVGNLEEDPVPSGSELDRNLQIIFDGDIPSLAPGNLHASNPELMSIVGPQEEGGRPVVR